MELEAHQPLAQILDDEGVLDGLVGELRDQADVLSVGRMGTREYLQRDACVRRVVSIVHSCFHYRTAVGDVAERFLTGTEVGVLALMCRQALDYDIPIHSNP